ncbi:hypothetical protein N9A08_06340 [Arthrobacter koreensis]|uniref:TPR-repeat-containing protein n=2 Tax=Arthrobacter koreensis TaxID=199136 RepID=A0ABY6FWW6_9MICC|nr:hypothetical protein [Arthrobacter koreensis]UYB37262.1 hypothetical protein N9A08_06340 [Arthrobacter koreensis]
MSEQNNREERDSQGRPRANDRKPPQRKSYNDRQSSSGRPARDGERKPFGKEGASRKSFSKDRGDRPGRDGERRSYNSDRGERKPFSKDSGERKPFSSDRGDRPGRDGERRSYSSDRGDRKPFAGRDDRKPFSSERGERKSWNDRPARDGERKPFSKDSRDRKPFGDRPGRDGERRSFNSDRGERKPFSKDSRDRKPFGDRPARDGDRKPFRKDDRPQRSNDRPQRHGTEEAPVTERKHNARDLRSANRAGRERSPEIDDDVTGQELDKVTRAQLRNLEEVNGEWVSKHLVMAGRLIDTDPELAFQHALAASRRGGRLAAVREAVALTAYAAGEFGDALREFRTHRRISGSNEYLAMMADCERGLGRPDRALDLVRSEEAAGLDNAGKVDIAIVASGARMDMEQYDAAVSALEIPQLDKNRAFSYSPRLFRAYADALELAGRGSEAEPWRRQALLAESVLGVGAFAEPEIMDLGEDDEPAGKPRFRRDSDADGDSTGPDAGTGEDRSGNYAERAETEANPADVDVDAEEDDALPSDERESLLGAEETESDSEDEDARSSADSND